MMHPLNEHIILTGKSAGESSDAYELGKTEERQRISRDIHDGIGCLISVTRMLFDTIEPVNKERYEEVRLLLEQTQTELKNIVKNSMPSQIEDLGLEGALKELSRLVNQKSGLELITKLSGLNDFIFDDKFKVDVYRIVQELINNSIKHAQASKMELLLNQTNDSTYIIYTDNGVGVSKKPKDEFSVNARILDLGGEWKIGDENPGVRFEIILPIYKPNNVNF